MKFKSLEGRHQVIDIQLPTFVHTNNFYSGRSHKYKLIDGPLVVRDKENELKAVIFTKEKVKRNFSLVNLLRKNKPQGRKKKIECIMYKYSEETFQKLTKKKHILFPIIRVLGVKIKKIKNIKDILY